MTPSQRLKQAIEDAGIGYVELGRKSGVAKSSIQRYASGVTKKIPIEAIEKIAPILGVSPAWIMDWADEEMSTVQTTAEEEKRALLAGKLVSLEDAETVEAIEVLFELEEPELSIARGMLLSLKKHDKG